MKKFGLWLTSAMLAYSFYVPVAFGAEAQLEEKSSAAMQEEQQVKQEQQGQQEQQAKQIQPGKQEQQATQEEQAEEKQHGKHKHSHAHPHKKLTSEEIQHMRLKKLQRLATYFEINTEGKSLEQLKKEVDQAKREQPEKWEAFKEEFRAKKLEKIREYAKQKGIDVEGKSMEQLHDELHELEERHDHS